MRFVLATKSLFSDAQAFTSFSKCSGYQAVEPFLVAKQITGKGGVSVGIHTLPWYRILIPYLIVKRILIPSSSPHRLRTCLLKLNCFMRFPSDNKGLMFCEYDVKSACDLNHLSVVWVEHQLLIAFSSEEYEHLAFLFNVSTNSSFAPLALAAWSRSFLSYYSTQRYSGPLVKNW